MLILRRHLERVRADDSGFTLPEMLVVTLLLLVVSTFVTASLASGMRRTTTLQHRVEAANDMQRVMERMTRDIRVAHPITTAAGVRHLRIASATPTQLVVRVVREEPTGSSFAYSYRYAVVCPVGGTCGLHETRRRSAVNVDPVTAPVNGPNDARILDNVPAGRTVFRYFDAAGAELVPGATGLSDVQRRSVVRVSVDLARLLPDQPTLTLSTRVTLRNVEA